MESAIPVERYREKESEREREKRGQGLTQTTQERVLSKGEERKTCKDKATRWEKPVGGWCFCTPATPACSSIRWKRKAGWACSMRTLTALPVEWISSDKNVLICQVTEKVKVPDALDAAVVDKRENVPMEVYLSWIKDDVAPSEVRYHWTRCDKVPP